MNNNDNIIIAIDPGANGGIAVWDGNRATVEPMPDTETEIAAAIDNIVFTAPSPAMPTAYVEKVGGFVKGAAAPGSAMFNFGKSYGILLGVLAAFRVRTVLVTPQAWQKGLGLGTRGKDTDKAAWKRKLKGEAGRLYPECRPTLKTSDALLILEYARRKEAAR